MSKIIQSSKHIYLQDADANTEDKCIYSFNMQDVKNEFSFAETMMKQFTDLGLDQAEKMVLSIQHRKIICKYKSIDQKLLKKIGRDVFHAIAEKVQKKVDVRIKASGIMAYFCVAAMYAGKLPKNKHIVFELSAIPLTLFPKSLIKEMPNSPEIIFFIERENWISPFKSLYQCPGYMNLNHSYVDRHQLRKFAA